MLNESAFIEKELKKRLLEIKNDTEPQIFSAMLYSLIGGGKRVRPTLMLLSADMFSVSRDKVLPYALAIECIHTYSLIHDDLPAMDDSDTRRGIPSVHKVYGEAVAILAGDALLNLGYEILFSACDEGGSAVKAAKYLAESAGSCGMVGGQAEEMQLKETYKSLTDGELRERMLSMYSKKTGALIRASIMIPFILSSQTQNEKEILQIAEDIGLIFQLADDIIDSKEAGSNDDGLTLVSLDGTAAAIRLIKELNERFFAALDNYGPSAIPLKEYAAALSRRTK